MLRPGSMGRTAQFVSFDHRTTYSSYPLQFFFHHQNTVLANDLLFISFFYFTFSLFCQIFVGCNSSFHFIDLNFSIRSYNHHFFLDVGFRVRSSHCYFTASKTLRFEYWKRFHNVRRIGQELSIFVFCKIFRHKVTNLNDFWHRPYRCYEVRSPASLLIAVKRAVIL